MNQIVKTKCTTTTLRGRQCKRCCVNDEIYCFQHLAIVAAQTVVSHPIAVVEPIIETETVQPILPVVSRIGRKSTGRK